MHKPLCALVAFVATGLGLSSTALGVVDIFDTRGTSCKPEVPSIAASLRYDRFGVGNANTGGTKTVNCGATLPLGTISAARATVLDRHPVENIGCNMMLTNGSGVPLASSSKFSSGSSANSQELTFNLPATFAGNFTMRCDIPQIELAVSYVHNYSITTDY